MDRSTETTMKRSAKRISRGLIVFVGVSLILAVAGMPAADGTLSVLGMYTSRLRIRIFLV